MSSEHKIIKWLNDGKLQPTHKFINFDEGEFFEPINENIQPKNLDIEIGDFVIVNGFYKGVLHTTPVKLYFDDDFGKVINIHTTPSNRKWYNISFNVLGFNKKASLPNTIWLQNGKDSNGNSFELDITLEYPEELDLDTLFDYN